MDSFFLPECAISRIVDDEMLKMDCFYEAKSASMRLSELRLLVLCGKGGSGFSLGGPFLAGDWSIGSWKTDAYPSNYVLVRFDGGRTASLVG